MTAYSLLLLQMPFLTKAATRTEYRNLRVRTMEEDTVVYSAVGHTPTIHSRITAQLRQRVSDAGQCGGVGIQYRQRCIIGS
jgi:hypothetical protein